MPRYAGSTASATRPFTNGGPGSAGWKSPTRKLKALEEASSPTIEIMAFIPEKSVDPLYYDKAYLLAPDKRGGKPYALLAEAMRKSGRCALA